MSTYGASGRITYRGELDGSAPATGRKLGTSKSTPELGGKPMPALRQQSARRGHTEPDAFDKPEKRHFHEPDHVLSFDVHAESQPRMMSNATMNAPSELWMRHQGASGRGPLWAKSGGDQARQASPRPDRDTKTPMLSAMSKMVNWYEQAPPSRPPEGPPPGGCSTTIGPGGVPVGPGRFDLRDTPRPPAAIPVGSPPRPKALAVPKRHFRATSGSPHPRSRASAASSVVSSSTP